MENRENRQNVSTANRPGQMSQPPLREEPGQFSSQKSQGQQPGMFSTQEPGQFSSQKSQPGMFSTQEPGQFSRPEAEQFSSGEFQIPQIHETILKRHGLELAKTWKPKNSHFSTVYKVEKNSCCYAFKVWHSMVSPQTLEMLRQRPINLSALDKANPDYEIAKAFAIFNTIAEHQKNGRLSRVVKIEEIFLDDVGKEGFLSILMEWYTGNLLEYCKKSLLQGQNLEMLRIFRECAMALQEIHQNLGIAHRDIKPYNFLWKKEDGSLRIVACDTDTVHLGFDTDSLTTTVPSTTGYLAPAYKKWAEHRIQEKRTSQDDIYALGCSFYQLCDSEFNVPDQETKRRYIDGKIPPRGSVQEVLCALLCDYGQIPKTADAVVSILEATIRQEISPKKRFSWSKVVGFMLVVLAVSGIAAYLWGIPEYWWTKSTSSPKQDSKPALPPPNLNAMPAQPQPEPELSPAEEHFLKSLEYSNQGEYGKAWEENEMACGLAENQADEQIRARCGINKARMLYSGEGVPRDRENRKSAMQVARAFEKKLLLRDKTSDYFLTGWLQEVGIGIGMEADFQKAAEYYRTAAENGFTLAMVKLALFEHQKAVRGKADDNGRKAVEWYEKAASKDNVQAMDELGGLYEKGVYVSQDEIKAKEWYEKAAAKGSPMAMAHLGSLYYKAQKWRDAIDWYSKASENHEPLAMYNLASMYEGGLGVPKNKERAKELYRKVIELAEGQIEYGEIVKEAQKRLGK